MPVKTMSVKSLIKERNQALERLFTNTEVEPEYTVSPKQLTNELLVLGTGQSDSPNASGKSGLILDTEAILQIKRYEKKGLSLPDTEDEIYTYLGQYQVEIPGLTNAELLITFVSIQENAGSWAAIESSIIDISIKLDAFADEMIDDGGQANEFLEEILSEYWTGENPIDPDLLNDPEYIQEVLENLDVESDVAEEQAFKLEATKRTIDTLVDKAQGYYETSNNLLTILMAFKAGLTACSDDVKGKEELCDQLDIEGELEEKKAQLDEKKARLEELNAQYSKEVGLAFTGIVGGAIGIIVTGTIFGIEASNTRDEIKELEQEIEDLENEIDGLNRLLYAITSLDSTLEGMYTAIEQAEIGVNQVITAWSVIVEDLKISSDACEAVENSEDVLDLWINFLDTVDPWENIKGNAALVTQQFNDALEQWLAEQNQEGN